ncbi:MAG: DUF2290 domain-containing protein [Deltaproteobacteria bacterium]|nr:DUF2290 domain-containing protein [Deltaproteobacteria bacterium]
MTITPRRIQKQVEILTSELIGFSLCNDQQFPSMTKIGRGKIEIGISGSSGISSLLRNIPYKTQYDEMLSSKTYNIKMIDGALLQLMYRFDKDVIAAHRLGFFPSPYLEEFQNKPNVYLEDEIYADIVMKNIIPFPFRFDYNSDNADNGMTHSASHLTLGQYKNCRIPVTSPLTPSIFIEFVLRNFYNTAFGMYSKKLTKFVETFSETMTSEERSIVYMCIP